MDDIHIRSAGSEDLPAITDTYNEAILTTTATFDTQPKTVAEQKRWFDEHGSKYPIMVAEVKGEVLGWASVSRWSDRCAYSDRGEISIYVTERARGTGIGRKLFKHIIGKAREVGLHTLIARIADANERSVRLHESLGFEKTGVMREVGRKFDRLLDVHLYQIVFTQREEGTGLKESYQ